MILFWQTFFFFPSSHCHSRLLNHRSGWWSREGLSSSLTTWPHLTSGVGPRSLGKGDLPVWQQHEVWSNCVVYVSLVLTCYNWKEKKIKNGVLIPVWEHLPSADLQPLSLLPPLPRIKSGHPSSPSTHLPAHLPTPSPGDAPVPAATTCGCDILDVISKQAEEKRGYQE